MRSLKLQMQISLDSFVQVEKGAANFNWDDEIRNFSIENVKNVDSILLSRNTAGGFIPHWKRVAGNPADPDYEYGKLLTEIPKMVFSKKPKEPKWDNTTLINGDVVEEVNKLKKSRYGWSKEIMVYGGHSFVSSLIKHGLIDEYWFLVNPFVAGSGESIFNSVKKKLKFTLKRSEHFKCGTVLLSYSKQV